ncbi:MAG: cobyrinate a,c-diamide synthase [Bacillota bacterium]|nr:cobyrinate a,c-diamide synthase [Bacillota bacterium]
MKGFVLAGTNSGVGKTTVSIGIMKALKKRGLKVAPFKVGPDYIDTAFHAFVTKTPSHNIDLVMLDEYTNKKLFYKHINCKSIAVVEGVMGLYDGVDFSLENGSTAQVSKILGLPVILILKPKGVGASILAQIKGYVEYDNNLEIKGIILNETSEAMYRFYKSPIENNFGIKCIGHIPKEDKIIFGSRHLGLVPVHETKDLEEKIDKAANLIEKHIDLDYLISIENKELKPLMKNSTKEKLRELKSISKGINLGYAYDEAFNFYYNDNLELLEEIGVNLIKFSPIKDKEIDPRLDGIYLGGGFPEVFADKLSKNQSMKNSIKENLNRGMFAYGECGGFMYLCKSVRNLTDKKKEMVGFYNFDIEMTKKLNRFGYIEVEMENKIKTIGHEFHRSRIIDETEDKDVEYGYKVEKISNRKAWDEGFKKKNVIGGYPHIHFYSNLEFLKSLIMKTKKKRSCL